MSFYETLEKETAPEREKFLAIPLVEQAVRSGGPRPLYLAFLEQAYHHVSHTFPLLAFAASRTTDERYQDALVEYMEEERGHEKWILDDIRILGGDAQRVREGQPAPACAIMVGYAYYAIEHISPYAMLGSVHVLEGTYEALRMSARHVSPDDLANGVVLACRIVPTSDLVVEPAPSPLAGT